VVLQAAATGCPIIVSENAGASDFVTKNKCGFVVPARSTNTIADKLQFLADDKNLLNEFSHNAINSTKAYTWSDYVDKLDDIILKFKNNR
jgi:glycosyltransferase involved in cell wall biosynthesis